MTIIALLLVIWGLFGFFVYGQTQIDFEIIKKEPYNKAKLALICGPIAWFMFGIEKLTNFFQTNIQPKFHEWISK